MTATKADAQTVDLAVCVDCLFLLANGEVTDSNGEDITHAHWAKMAGVWGEDFDITLGPGECEYCPTEDNGDCEPWFSWSRCDGCHSDLGGDRQHATAWLNA